MVFGKGGILYEESAYFGTVYSQEGDLNRKQAIAQCISPLRVHEFCLINLYFRCCIFLIFVKCHFRISLVVDLPPSPRSDSHHTIIIAAELMQNHTRCRQAHPQGVLRGNSASNLCSVGLN